ncbi:Fur family transcriptional regulator [Rhodoferax sp.]|uniref:Fur family transcriptional regulator n=1 Tax=Rhodoferax sp. TaxID=50421 RepID=UPI00374D16F9
MSRSLPSTDTAATSSDDLLVAHGLRRTNAARTVVDWLRAHADSSWTHAQLQESLARDAAVTMDRVTLYRLLDRLSEVGLLRCRVDAERVRHYQAIVDDAPSAPHFECKSCHRDLPLSGQLDKTNAELAQAAIAAIQALQTLGQQSLSVDLAVRGICGDCAPASKGMAR